MSRICALLLASLVLLASARLSPAHELKVLASYLSLSETGQRTTIYLSWGDVLPVHDLVDPKSLDRYDLITPEGSATALKRSELSLQTNVVNLKEEGTYQVIACRKPAVLTLVEDAKGNHNLHFGPKTTVKEGKISRAFRSQQFAKALIVVRSTEAPLPVPPMRSTEDLKELLKKFDSNDAQLEEQLKKQEELLKKLKDEHKKAEDLFKEWDKRRQKENAIPQPAKLPIEIVPLDPPKNWLAGSTLRFQVLFQSKPLPEEMVAATHLGFEPADAWCYAAETDRKGVFRLRPGRAGSWVLRVNVRRPAADSMRTLYDDESYTATLALAIQP